MMLRLFAGALWVGSLCEAYGQSAAVPRSFEVASIRPRQGPFSRLFIISSTGPRFTAEACTILELIMYAYKLKSYQVSFATPLAEREARYDVMAKAADDAAPDETQFRQMMQ